MKIFFQNLEKIERRNKNSSIAFKLGINQFADIEFEEFRARNAINETIVKLPETFPYDPIIFDGEENMVEIPNEFDWRDLAAVSKVKNQKDCGSCYAMSAIAAIESQLMIRFGISTELSVQEIIDCAGSYQTFGCDGGMKFRVFDYIQENGGISLDSDYTYKGIQSDCKLSNYMKLKLKIVGYGKVNSFDDELLKRALFTIGPIVISLNTNHESFMRYSSGIYYEPACTDDTNHAALLVGFGSEQGQDYWIVKNSYGMSWGESGFIRIARNLGNDCGVTSELLYPIVESVY